MDKVCKEIIKRMISGKPSTEYVCSFSGSLLAGSGTTIYELSDAIGVDPEDIRAAVRFLESAGYVEYQTMKSPSKGSIIAGFHLSHKGLHWKYFRRKEILNYIADKWVDFFAALIALLSLILSIIALTQSPR